MADLTATNVSVTLAQEDIDRSMDKMIKTFPQIAFGNGVLTYPAGGIPMPSLGAFGFNFTLKRAYVEQPADGYVYSFDRANHTLRILQSDTQAVPGAMPMVELGHVAVAATVLDLELVGN